MGLFSRKINKESRGSSSGDPYLAKHLGMREGGGQIVSPDTASGIPAVHACVQVIAETIATLPCNLYRRGEDGSKEIDRDSPLQNLLNAQANPSQNSMEFREQLIASCALTGNGYALKEINNRGEVVALYPLRPGQVHIEKLQNGRTRYRVLQDNSNAQTYIQDEVLHLRYRSSDGVSGLSPITIARGTIGSALSQQQYEASFYENAARPSGSLEFPGRLTMEQMQHIKTSMADQYSGSGKVGKIIVLEEGAKFNPISLNQKDAEFIESRKLTLEDIARIYRVPPPSIGILDNATYSNITEQSRMLVMHCLRPWMVRIEKVMMMSLLTDIGKRTHFIEHNADGLLRGSLKDRYEAYRISREWGWMNVNEIRRKENFAGIGSEGDTYRQPMNSEPLGTE